MPHTDPSASVSHTAERLRARLDQTLSALIGLLEHHDVRSWPDTLRSYQRGIRAGDPAVIIRFAAHNRSGFAGILDLIITPGNGHTVPPDHEAEVDTALSHLRSEVIRDVNALENLLYNIHDPAGGFLCPVCGFSGAFNGTSFDEHGGVIGTGICPCCLFEPGFDDDPGASAHAKHTVTDSVASFREHWLAAGSPWSSITAQCPAAWNAEAQLAHLFQVAPYFAHH
jgi:hypothetical protein